MPIYQVGPNKWSNRPPQTASKRSALGFPFVISDEMPPTEQIDGKFYTSKCTFRAVGRVHGLVEVGTERPKPKQRTVGDPRKRRAAIGKAVAQYRAGRRIKED
jgi:hypothetical protein